MKSTIAFLVAVAALTAGLGAGGCRSCAEKADLDVVPGMKDSGIPDPHAVKEHEKEIEQLNKDVEALSRELAQVAMDPNLSAAEKKRRTEEIGKEMEIKSKRLKEIAEDITNRKL